MKPSERLEQFRRTYLPRYAAELSFERGCREVGFTRAHIERLSERVREVVENQLPEGGSTEWKSLIYTQ